MDTDRIYVTRGLTLGKNKDVITVIGAITAQTLVSKGKIPLYDPKRKGKKQGYQRPVQMKRVIEIAKGIKEKKVDLPTAILISIRESDAAVLSETDNCHILDLSSVKFNIVDGQHRYAAIKILQESKEISNDYKIPFVCMIGASEDMEVHQFWVVNSTAQKVPTDLALKLLANIVHSDRSGKMMDDLIAKETDWKVKGQDLLDHLDKSSSIWKGRIRLPATPKAKTTIPSTSMVTSFEKIFKGSSLFNSMDHQRQGQALDAYWKGIQKVIPDAFSNPEKYSLQKGIGVRTMHGIFPDVLERARGKKRSIYSPDVYAEIIKEPLENISGENRLGNTVGGAAFWAAGKEGAAATYSNSIGIRTLIDKIKRLLPDIEIENIK